MALVMMTGVHPVLGRKLFGDAFFNMVSYLDKHCGREYIDHILRWIRVLQDCFEGIIRKMKCSLFFGSLGLFRRERWGAPWEGGAHIKGP